ncbi:hypothetical protein [Acetobacter indonesiensis]|uniref:hypothetical protein n=1 Tax=Acetobacter indonesiensis TaxID=104101 RepID=UPI0039E8BD15
MKTVIPSKSGSRIPMESTRTSYEESVRQAGFRPDEPVTQLLLNFCKLVEDFDARLTVHGNHVATHHQFMKAYLDQAIQKLAAPPEQALETPKQIVNGAVPPNLTDEVRDLSLRALRQYQLPLWWITIVLGVVMALYGYHLHNRLIAAETALAQKEQLSKQRNLNLNDIYDYLSKNPDQLQGAKIIIQDNDFTTWEFQESCRQSLQINQKSWRRYCRPLIYIDSPGHGTNQKKAE